MKYRTVSFLLFVGLVFAAIGPARAAEPVTEQEATPFQLALQSAVQERVRSGLPVPTNISYDYRVAGDSAQKSAGVPQQVTVTGVTIMTFTGPAQAGYSRWPAPVIEDALPPGATGVVASGDYSAQVRAELARALPGIWEAYEFGTEPRRYTLEETITVTYPAIESAEVMRALAADTTAYATSQDVLLGFMYLGPKIDYTIGGKWEACTFLGCATLAEARAGFALDWAVGLRLPFEVGVTAPAYMNTGDTTTLTTQIQPRDWDAAEYARAGFAPESGNEYVLRFSFFFGARLKLLGISVIDWALDTSLDNSKSFMPPFGAGASFPIPSLNLTPDETGLNFGLGGFMSLGVGLRVDPLLGSNRITAAWEGVPGTDVAGSGTLTYTEPNAPVDVGPLTFGDFGPTGIARVRLHDFRYWFNQFLVRLSGSLYLNVFGYGTRSGDFNIGEVNLGALTGSLSLGVFPGTSGMVDRTVWVVSPPTTDVFVVNTATDIFDPSLCSDPMSACSLRTAIWWANQQPGRQTIMLPAGQYALTRGGAGEDRAEKGDLDIADDITIIGDGADVTVIDGQQSDRVLDVAAGADLELREVTLANGLATLPTPTAGGGLRNRGSVILIGCRIEGNQAEYGGGIHNSGVLELTFGSELLRNTALHGGGGIYSDGQLHVSNSSILDNHANDGGGGVLNWGGTAVIINDTLVSGNDAPNGGGIENGGNGLLEIANSTVANNIGTLHGGGLVNFAGGQVTIHTGSRFIDNSLLSTDAGSLDHGGGAIHNFAGGGVDIADSVISNNSALAAPSALPVGGGAIRNLGELTIADSSLISNRSDYGGGIHNAAGATLEVHRSLFADSHAIGGGGIYNEGDAWLSSVIIGGIGAGNSSTGTAVPGNEAVGGGGVLNWGGTVDIINDSQVVDNRAANGGGLENGNGGQLKVTNSLVARNRATLRGGGLVNFVGGQVQISAGSNFYANRVESDVVGMPDAGGGAVLNMAGARIEIRESRFNGNSAISNEPTNPIGGGGVRNLGDLIVMDSIIENNQADMGGAIAATDGRIEISTTDLQGNSAIIGYGGAITLSGGSMLLSASQVNGNHAIAGGATSESCGGGIALQGGDLTIRDTRIADNETNATPGNWGYGGGICSRGGTLTLVGSTISGNNAGGATGGIGGGLFNRNGDVSALNSTISGNSAINAEGNGGGLANQNGSIHLSFVTIAQNSAALANGLTNTFGQVELQGSIITGPPGILCNGTFVDRGSNIQYPGTTCGTTIPEVDPRIGALSDNGGSTQTHELLPDSPAINAIAPAVCPTGVAVDQRGVLRPQGTGCDIGAYELVQLSAIADEGATAVLNLPPDADAAGVALNLVNMPFGGPLQVLASVYRTNPAPQAFLDTGGGYVDVRVFGADAADSMHSAFYYPVGVSEATERNLTLWYFSDAGWRPVLSSGGVPPIHETADMPDGLAAGGRLVVEFDATSTPPLTALDGTVFAMSIRTAPLCANVLDTFNRPAGPLGILWLGKAKKDYKINYESVDVGYGGPIYWAAESFGAEQVACVTLTRNDLNARSEGLLLKVQGADWGRGAINVFYLPGDEQLGIDVFVRRSSWAWERIVLVDQVMHDGDRLAAAALADGTVQVYVNEKLVVEGDAGAFFAKRGGRTGIWFDRANDARFDDFAGGSAR